GDFLYRTGWIARERLDDQWIDRFGRVVVRNHLCRHRFGLRSEFLLRECGEGEPRREDRVLLLLPFVEPGNPALHGARIKFALPGERFGLGLVVEPLPF